MLACALASAGGHSPTSPLRPTNDMRFASETEYSATFSGSQLRESLRTSSYTRGNSSQPLWLSIGGQRYSTETSDKYSGHMPPPAAPRPVPKWQPNTLHLHGETTYGDSFVAYGASASKAEIHKPVAQTKPLYVW
ncbi:hypothetical protein EON67_00170 [archaeon]|nr:MAG: hypothetical protein EON67_00170 [archaeon]